MKISNSKILLISLIALYSLSVVYGNNENENSDQISKNYNTELIFIYFSLFFNLN